MGVAKPNSEWIGALTGDVAPLPWEEGGKMRSGGKQESFPFDPGLLYSMGCRVSVRFELLFLIRAMGSSVAVCYVKVVKEVCT